MESIPSTSASRMRKHRASLSVEDLEKRRAADRLRKSRKKDEANRQVILTTNQLDHIGNDIEIVDAHETSTSDVEIISADEETSNDVEVENSPRMPLSSTERSRIHRAGASAVVIEQRRRSERIRGQQNRGAETEEEKA
ncbi:hypothetical protein Fcan01_16156, partial [Folsomia candida]